PYATASTNTLACAETIIKDIRPTAAVRFCGCGTAVSDHRRERRRTAAGAGARNGDACGAGGRSRATRCALLGGEPAGRSGRRARRRRAERYPDTAIVSIAADYLPRAEPHQ